MENGKDDEQEECNMPKMSKDKQDVQVPTEASVTVHWLDACFDEAHIEDILLKKPKDFLVRSKTHGRIIKEDEHAIIIAVCEAEKATTDFYAIPQPWVIKVERGTDRG